MPPPSASRAYPSPSSTDRVGTDVLSTRTLLSIKKEAIEAELKSIEALSQQFKASDSLPNEFINAWDALNRSISDYETFYLPRADGLLPIDQKAHQDFITNIRQTQKKMGLTGH
ncbi:MAG: phosphoenolpyruvate carboxykinase (GTP) [Vampirovibrio sp.]